MINTKFSKCTDYDLKSFEIVCDCIGDVIFFADSSCPDGYYLALANPTDDSQVYHLMSQRGYTRVFKSLDYLNRFIICLSRKLNLNYQFVVDCLDYPEVD